LAFEGEVFQLLNTQKGKKVLIQGLQDFIVVEKEDMLVIYQRKDQQDIKKIVSQVKDTFGVDSV